MNLHRRSSLILASLCLSAGIWFIASHRRADPPGAPSAALRRDAPRVDDTRPAAKDVLPARPGAAATRSAPQIKWDARRPAAPASTLVPEAGFAETVADESVRPTSTSETREERIATARRELESLQVQKPENFLALFDIMKKQRRWDEGKLDEMSEETHRYIVARADILHQMLRRFIDDPESDHTLETEALARIDEDFKEKLDGCARDIPDVATIQEILTTTTLRAPHFTDEDSNSP